MPNGQDATRRRLEQLLREAGDAIAQRPVQAHAPILRARRAIRVRYAAITASFVALTVVLTATAVVARDRLVRDDSTPTGPTATTGPETTTPTIAPPPEVTIRDGPPDPTNETTATFLFDIDGPGTAECSVDGQLVAAPCESGVQVTVVEGPHLFRVVGVDGQGNRGDPDTYGWRVDLTPPTVTFASAVLEYAAAGAEPECNVNDDPFACVEPVTGLSGRNIFGVALTGTGKVLSWDLDPTPGSVLLSATGDEAVPAMSTLRLTFEPSEEAIVVCTIDDVQVDCMERTVVDRFADGETPHVIQVTPTDLAGNVGSAAVFTWSFSFQQLG